MDHLRHGFQVLDDHRAVMPPGSISAIPIAFGSIAAGRFAAHRRSVVAVLAIAVLAGCQTSALGRRQFKMMSETEMSEMGASAFADISKQTPPSRDALTNAKVTCVAKAITQTLSGVNSRTSWEIRVFADDTPNAFALPGGKIGVNTGLMEVALTQGQLAAVIGHEVTHVTQGHANERVSAELAKNSALQVASVLADVSNPAYGQMIGLLGAGVQVGVMLPFGRAQETEADLVGLDLMAKAGFDPRESIALWQNMAKAGGSRPPEFLSTHPAYGTRMRDLEARMPIAMPLYEDAKSSGRAPRCY